MPRPSAARAWARSASSASLRLSPTRFSTPRASASARCRSPWRSCSDPACRRPGQHPIGRDQNHAQEAEMKIGIIGAGQIGGTLTRRLTALGHKVSVANSRGPETLAGLAKETGARAVTIKEAARAGDVVIVTIPEKNIAELPKDLFAGVPDNVVVIDTGNYY